MLVAFSISPTSSDPSGSVTEAVAAAVRVVRESGLPHETNAMFTNIEGEWDEVMAVVKRAVDVVAEVSPRVGLVLKADIRPGYDGSSPPRSSASSRHSVESEVRSYRTGGEEVVLDLTRDAGEFVTDRATGSCMCSCPTRPPGWPSSRPAPGPTTTCSLRSATCCPPTTAGGTGTGPGSRPLARDAGRRAAVLLRAGPRRSLALGTWQSICLVDLNVDNADRDVRFSFIAG